MSDISSLHEFCVLLTFQKCHYHLYESGGDRKVSCEAGCPCNGFYWDLSTAHTSRGVGHGERAASDGALAPSTQIGSTLTSEYCYPLSHSTQLGGARNRSNCKKVYAKPDQLLTKRQPTLTHKKPGKDLVLQDREGTIRCIAVAECCASDILT